ncbi:MAG TPA: response regulator [Bryobacteraceae bacterium]|jgi:two-component system, response regulator|nr:response regulator [Bryobacteraceae bacterium]
MISQSILLIEDNSSDIALAKRAFEKARIVNELVVAEDGQEALDYIFGLGAFAGRDPAEIPLLTLMDLKLPKLSALDLLKRIRADARTRRMPVVILTSSNEDQDIAAGYDLGVNSFIRKPVDFNQFVHTVEQLALYWLLLNEPPPLARVQASP